MHVVKVLQRFIAPLPSGAFAVGVRNPLQDIAFPPLRTELYLHSLFINALDIAILSLGDKGS